MIIVKFFKYEISCYNSNTHNTNCNQYINYVKTEFNRTFKDYWCTKSITYQFWYISECKRYQSL